MVCVMSSYAKDGYLSAGELDGNIVSCMIESGKTTTNDQKKEAGDYVAGNQPACNDVHCEQMVVLTHDELKRVDINGVHVPTRRNNLSMMVLMHQSVHSAVMKGAMEQCVKEVVHDKERRQCDAGV